MDERTGVSTKIKETATELNERLRLAERSRAAADAAKGAAASLADKAREFNEKHKIVERGRGLASDAAAAASSVRALQAASGAESAL